MRRPDAAAAAKAPCGVGGSCDTAWVTLYYHGSMGSPPEHWVSGDPREVWPRETTHFHPWLVDNLDALARCLGLERLEVAGRGREVQVGTQWLDDWDPWGNEGWVGGMRVDLDTRDERGRRVIVEAQVGPADHGHCGQLLVYAHGAEADLAVWVIAHHEPSLLGEQLELLAEFNQMYVARRQFAVVEVTVESERRPAFVEGDPLIPRMRRVDVVTQIAGPAVTARLPASISASAAAARAPRRRPGPGSLGGGPNGLVSGGERNRARP